MSISSPLTQSPGGLKSDQRLIGIVVDNNDPQKTTQRVRVTIPGLLESENIEELPWLLPSHKSVYGVGDNYGVVQVPRIGARVVVKFQGADLSYGVYEHDATTTNLTLPKELLENFPNRIGFSTPSGDLFYNDLTTGEVRWRHASGTSISIDGDGNVALSVAGNLTEYIHGNHARIVNGDSSEVVKGSKVQTVGGAHRLAVSGNSATSVGGSYSVIVSSSMTTVCSKHSHSGTIRNVGDIFANGVSLENHDHGGVDTGGGNTAPPN